MIFLGTGVPAIPARAQSASTPGQARGGPPAAQAAANARAVVVLDPAHGGPDAGAKLGDQLLEKDVTLALAARLKAALIAAGFTVVSTREADSLTLLTADQRAETANRAHALACLVIHATSAGGGVHLYASTLAAKEPADAAAADLGPDFTPAFEPVPWDSAQAGSVEQSLRLQAELGAALRAAGIALVSGRAPVRPLDNMMCPALAVEVAPLKAPGEDEVPVSDPNYQQRLANALTKALQGWRAEAAATTAAPAGGTQ
jgi:N-acetylmuramoyl-L-alanine amidase